MSGVKTVVVKVPDPEFFSPESLREKTARRFIQERIRKHLTDPESLFRKLLERFHGEQLVSVIAGLLENEGIESETAEAYLVRIVDEFRIHSPLEMFLHYMATEDLEKAAECYEFFPMQHRFLEISTVTGGLAVKVKCSKSAALVEEFDYLCEELGLSYRATRPAAVVPQELDQVLSQAMSGDKLHTNLKPLKISDIIGNSPPCKDGE